MYSIYILIIQQHICAIHSMQLENNLMTCYAVLWTLHGNINNRDFTYLQCNQQKLVENQHNTLEHNHNPAMITKFL